MLSPPEKNNYTVLTDEALLSLSAFHRDERACEELVKRYENEIFRFVKRMGVPQLDAEDLCQDIWLKIWSVKNYQDNYEANCRAYIYRSARNAIADYWKSRDKRSDLERGEKAARELFTEVGVNQIDEDTVVYEPYDPQPGPDAFIEESARFKRFEECWEKLSDAKKEVILMSRFEGKMTLKDIAEVIEVEYETVKSRLRNGLKDLYDCMGKLLKPVSEGRA